MARPSLLSRFLGSRSTSGEAASAAPPARPPRLTPGQLRRERKALLRAREERIRDLGGLMLEMYKRDRFNEELVFEQCGELVSLEARLAELDELLAAVVAASGRPAPGASRCECGAPILWDSHFCANCGRAVSAPIVACAHCGNPLAADAKFCPTCGNRAETAAEGGAEPAEAYAGAQAEETEATEVREAAASTGAEPEEGAEPPKDPWER